MVGQHLKQADRFLLQHNFAAAEEEVKKALELEPTNLYARAYKERIATLRREYEVKQKKEEEERRRQAEEKAKRIQKSETQIPKPEASRFHTPLAPSSTLPQKVIEEYKIKLQECWHDGALTPQEFREIEQMRKLLNISPDQHKQLEHETKLNCYVNSVTEALKAGNISPIKSKALEDLRAKFNITVEEHLTIEGRILYRLQHQQGHATILLIDDEKDLLQVVGEGLEDHGYTALTAQSPEQALQILEEITPDVILCDIEFPASPLDGFSIYKKVRSMRETMALPFIFITGIKDEWLQHQGLASGADDYLTKPFTMTTILSVIEGKLKRYEELKKALRAS